MRGLPVTGRSAVELGVVNRVPAVLFEDFISFGPALVSATPGSGLWVIGGTKGGGFAAATDIVAMDSVVADGADIVGAATLTTGAASGDEAFIQLEGAPFLCAVGRKMVFSTRLRLNTLTTTTLAFGMYAAGSVVGGAATEIEDTQANGFGFSIATTGVVSYQAKNATTTLANTAAGVTLTASTTTGWHTFEIYWDGVNTLEFWVDRTRYVQYTGAAIPLNIYLAPAIGLSTGSAVAKTVSADWIYAAVEAPTSGR